MDAGQAQEPNDDGLPYVTRSGVARFADQRLRVYQLNDARRIVDADDLQRFFGGAS
jgi:hypothetical protein